MSSEPPPQPVSDTFNYSQWNRDQNLTIAEAAFRYLSKVVSDTAAGLISFAAGIKTNTINAFSGTAMTIGDGTTTATNIYKPILSSTAPVNTDNSTSIISSAWVNTFWTYVRTQAYSWSGIQTFTGIITNSINVTGTGITLDIADTLVSGVIHIGKNMNFFGSVVIGGGLTGTVPLICGYIYSNALQTNDVSAVNFGDTMNFNVSSPSSITNISTFASRSAAVNLASGNSASGTLNIATGTNTTSPINILTGVGSTSTITVGGGTSSLVVNSPSVFSALPLSTGSYAAITGGDTSNTIITSNWINSTWLTYLRGLANTWTLLQTFTAGISCTLPIRVTYAPSTITTNTMIGYRYPADVSSVTVTSTRRCQCVLNGTAGVGSPLAAGVYTVSYTALLNTTTTGYIAGIVVRASITNGTTSATGGVLNLYGGLQQRSQSTTAPFYITGSTTLVLDGANCVSIGIESTTTQSANAEMWCQAIRIA